jgi:hypothetical protein
MTTNVIITRKPNNDAKAFVLKIYEATESQENKENDTLQENIRNNGWLLQKEVEEN